jgi:hypothetical protein
VKPPEQCNPFRERRYAREEVPFSASAKADGVLVVCVKQIASYSALPGRA